MKLIAWQVKRVVEYVETRIEQRLTVEDVARSIGLSGSHFCRRFSKTFGMSVHRYVMRRRVARAQALMMASDEPLCDIALRCGLADQSHLTRWFRRVTGTTPASWRRAQARSTSEPAVDSNHVVAWIAVEIPAHGAVGIVVLPIEDVVHCQRGLPVPIELIRHPGAHDGP
jgi:AraC-like DNA-binding protein